MKKRKRKRKRMRKEREIEEFEKIKKEIEKRDEDLKKKFF